MSDWARPDPDGPVEEARIEVPLAGEDADATPGTDDDDRPAPNWRKVTGISALAGIVLGLAVAIVVLTASSDDVPPVTTLDPDELSDAITVPPTLTPVTEPAVVVPATPLASAPSGALSTDLDLVAASVETLPGRPDADVEPDGFRLSDGSLAALDTPLARQSVTDYVVGVDGFEQTVTITNDPATGRYLIEFDLGDATQHVVIDLLGGLTYLESPPGEWWTTPNDEIAASAGATDMATFVRNLQLGPIRSDTRDAWERVLQNGIVDAPGEGLREYVVVLDATAVPEWARYAFGPGGDAAPLPGNTKVGFAVYVAADGSIRSVSGAAEYGATSQRIVHHIEELDTPPVIELPVADEPVTQGPADVGSVPAPDPAHSPSTTAPPG